MYLTDHDHRRDNPDNGSAGGLGAAAAIGLRPHAAAARNRLILIVAGVSSCLSRDTLSGFSQHLDTHGVLLDLRSIASDYLLHLPTPLGFNPSRNTAHNNKLLIQHRVGRDPPVAFVEALC